MREMLSFLRALSVQLETLLYEEVQYSTGPTVCTVRESHTVLYRSIRKKLGNVEESVQTTKVNKVIHDSTRRAVTWKGTTSLRDYEPLIIE
jgi:hypothetical protein